MRAHMRQRWSIYVYDMFNMLIYVHIYMIWKHLYIWYMIHMISRSTYKIYYDMILFHMKTWYYYYENDPHKMLILLWYLYAMMSVRPYMIWSFSLYYIMMLMIFRCPHYYAYYLLLSAFHYYYYCFRFFHYYWYYYFHAIIISSLFSFHYFHITLFRCW